MEETKLKVFREVERRLQLAINCLLNEEIHLCPNDYKIVQELTSICMYLGDTCSYIKGKRTEEEIQQFKEMEKQLREKDSTFK